jgi:hypothetical protein
MLRHSLAGALQPSAPRAGRNRLNLISRNWRRAGHLILPVQFSIGSMDMKRILTGVCAALALSGCATTGYGFYRGGDVSAFYDDAYGPFYNGYWGPGDAFYYSAGRQGPFVRDEARHFRREQAAGFHGVHGRPGLHHAPPGAMQQHR